MSAGIRTGRQALWAAVLLLPLFLFGAFLIDLVTLNISNIRTMKAVGLQSETRLTTWGSCRQAHITGRNLLLQGQYNAALPLLQEGVTCTDNPWAWFDLGRTQYALGNLDGAAESWQHTPEGYHQAVRLAQAAVQEGDRQTILAAWQFAAQVNPAEQSPYIQLARLAAESEPEQIEPLLRQAIEANPNAPAAYIELGRYFIQNGSPAEAQPLFEQALALDPTDVSLLIALAENAAVLGDTPAAIDYWEEVAMRSERRRASAYFQIGRLALNDNNLSSALAFFRRAVEIEPQNGQFLLGLAAAYFELGCRQEATDAYQDVLSTAESETIIAEAQLRLADLAVMTTETIPCPQ
jgi:tetratricopeptide (TPR) repeat protein